MSKEYNSSIPPQNMTPKEVATLKGHARQIFFRSQLRKQVMDNAKTEENTYTCALCQQQFKQNEVQVDHIIPLGQFTNWSLWLNRLFCPIKNLQVLCKSCHSEK